MVSTMIVAAPAQNNSVRTRREEAKLRRTIRDIVWERRGPYVHILDMPIKKVIGKSVRRVRTANWTRSLDASLLRLFKQEYIEGNFINGQFTKSAWARIVTAFNMKTRLSLNKGHLQNRLKVLKNTFRLYNDVATLNGWEWDSERNVPKPQDPSSWDRMIAVNPQYAKCRDKPFPAYPILKLFFVKSSASRQSQMNAMAGDFSDKGEGCSSSSFRSSEKNASSQKPKDIPLPYASNKEDADDDDNASASDDGSSSSQSGRTSAVSKALEELVEIGRRQQEIAKELLNRQLAAMPKVYSIEQCMLKLKTLRNMSSEAFLSVCDAFRDEHDRCIFMNLKGPILHAWIDRKVAMHSVYQQPIQPIQQCRMSAPPNQDVDFSRI
uniref:Myb/SANT-like domain-containing protein n=1 Tax=Ananas comosus var. bracteatus TaxID=296719 RepID=A0A6V7PWY4_ANACO|nr:unnamed protein product [Ananas comosus var. bracteatus]